MTRRKSRTQKLHRLLSQLILLSILIVTTWYSASAQPLNPLRQQTCSSPVRIMPLGDSITVGASSGVPDESQQISYRYDLWHSLAASGYYVDFVGNRVSGEFYTALDGFDADNQGKPGTTATFVANSINAWLTENPADIILLHIGTNNLTTDPSAVAQILDNIDAFNPNIVVVLARIINQTPFNNTVTQFNNNVVAMANARVGDVPKIVDMEFGAGLIYAIQPAGDMWDQLHPFETGYAKMADAWQPELDALLTQCFFAPQITSSPLTTAVAGQSYHYAVEVNDGGRPTTFQLITAPIGMTIDATTGVISWTPGSGGSYPVTIEAQNVVGIDTQSFTLEVDQAPAIFSTPITTGVTGNLYQYDVNASGIPAPTYTLLQAPASMSIDATSGLISWTPTAVGTYSIQIQASNRVGSATQAYVATIYSVPEISPIAGQQAVVGSPFNLTVSATGAPDPTFALINFPSGMMINPTTGAINWTPVEPVDVAITVRATNSVGSDDASFNIIVNAAPTITSTPILTTTINGSYNYPVAATGKPLPTFVLTTAPTGMMIDGNSGVISWTPSNSGTFDVVVQASNLVDSDMQAYVLSVWEKPTIVSTPITIGVVDEPYAYQVASVGFPAATYALSDAPAGMSIDANSGMITWIPDSEGSFTVSVKAGNAAGSTTQSFVVDVAEFFITVLPILLG